MQKLSFKASISFQCKRNLIILFSLGICTHVYMYVYIHIHIHVHIPVNDRVDASYYFCLPKQSPNTVRLWRSAVITYSYIYIYIYMYIDTCIYTCIHIYIYRTKLNYIYTCIYHYVYIHMYLHLCIDIL